MASENNINLRIKFSDLITYDPLSIWVLNASIHLIKIEALGARPSQPSPLNEDLN